MKRKKDSIEIDGWNTEIEAAQAYNILTLIFKGPDSEFNDVPAPAIETFNRVITMLNRQGWSATDTEMRTAKTLLRIHLGMKFRADA